MNLPQGWGELASKEHAQGLLRELQREVTPSHPLFEIECQAIATCNWNDDVLFQINSSVPRYALVHLTWRGSAESEGWPETSIFASFQEFQEFITSI